MLLTSAALCLALNIYHEARGEPVMGKYGVAMVTLNRAKRDEDKVCDVVFQRKQFSWTTQVKRTNAGYAIPKHLIPKIDNPIEAYSWERAQIIANVALSGRMWDFTGGANHYHAKRVNPSWNRNMVVAKVIGRHIFYVA